MFVWNVNIFWFIKNTYYPVFRTNFLWKRIYILTNFIIGYWIFSFRLVVQRSILNVLMHLKHGCWTNWGVYMPPGHPPVRTNSGNRSLWLSFCVIDWSMPWLIARLLRLSCNVWLRWMERFALTPTILLVLWVSVFTFTSFTS